MVHCGEVLFVVHCWWGAVCGDVCDDLTTKVMLVVKMISLTRQESRHNGFK